jgi:hypothetical protein
LGHPHWVVQVPQLRRCNAYTYSHSHSHRYTYGNSYSDSHVYSDRYGDLYAYCHCDIHTYGNGDLYTDSYGYVYAYCHCDIHTYGDCNSDCNRYGNRYRHRHRYSDANTSTSRADGIERYQPDYQQLYCELDQCQRCEQLPVRRIHEQYFWHLRTGIPEFGCRQRD